jgi:hypothetical protein
MIKKTSMDIFYHEVRMGSDGPGTLVSGVPPAAALVGGPGARPVSFRRLKKNKKILTPSKKENIFAYTCTNNCFYIQKNNWPDK